MPYRDPEKKKEQMSAWRKRMMADGYGRALYARRKQRFENEQKLREGLEDLQLSLAADLRGEAWILERVEKILASAPPVTGKPLDFMPKEKE